jgi:hypothetical protein
VKEEDWSGMVNKKLFETEKDTRKVQTKERHNERKKKVD